MASLLSTSPAASDNSINCCAESDGSNNNVAKGAAFSSSFLIDSIIGTDVSSLQSAVDCRLESADLWQRFHDLGTEMIITKSGRRMFPTIRVAFDRRARARLDPEAKYIVALDVVPVDHKRYRYAYHKSAWLAAGKATQVAPYRYYVHPDSPFTEQQLMQTVSFEKLKVTNNQTDRNGYVILNSMHKYQPRMFVFEEKHLPAFRKYTAQMAQLCAAGRVDSLTSPPEVKMFVFEQLQFTAVTAYQNQLITRLKIDSNPFAKGFRDSGRFVDLERERLQQALATSQALKAGHWPIEAQCENMPHSQALPSGRSGMDECESIDVDCAKQPDCKPHSSGSSLFTDSPLHEQLTHLLHNWLTPEAAAPVLPLVATDAWQLIASSALQLLAARQLYNCATPLADLEQLRQLQALQRVPFADQSAAQKTTASESAAEEIESMTD